MFTFFSFPFNSLSPSPYNPLCLHRHSPCRCWTLSFILLYSFLSSLSEHRSDATLSLFPSVIHLSNKTTTTSPPLNFFRSVVLWWWEDRGRRLRMLSPDLDKGGEQRWCWRMWGIENEMWWWLSPLTKIEREREMRKRDVGDGGRGRWWLLMKGGEWLTVSGFFCRQFGGRSL